MTVDYSAAWKVEYLAGKTDVQKVAMTVYWWADKKEGAVADSLVRSSENRPVDLMVEMMGNLSAAVMDDSLAAPSVEW